MVLSLLKNSSYYQRGYNFVASKTAGFYLNSARKVAVKFLPEHREIIFNGVGGRDYFKENWDNMLKHLPTSTEYLLKFQTLLFRLPGAIRLAESRWPPLVKAHIPIRSLATLALNNPQDFAAVGYTRQPKKASPVSLSTPDLRKYLNFIDSNLHPIPGVIKNDIDVLVIGSGPGAAAALYALLEKKPDLKVVILEKGPYVPDSDFGKFSPLEAINKTYLDGGLVSTLDIDLRRHGDLLSGIGLPLGQVVGGGHVINSGTFEYPPEKVILQNMPPSKNPVGIFNFHFYRAKQLLGVTPKPEEVMSLNNIYLKEAAEMAGLKARPLYGTHVGCEGIGQCPYGCPAGAKKHPANTLLPSILEKHPNVFLIANAGAKRFLLEGERVTGAEVELRDPENKQVFRKEVFKLMPDQGAVMLGAGIIGNHDILTNSGYRHQNLGKNLTVHPSTEVTFINTRQKLFAFRGLPQGMLLEFSEGVAEGAFPDPSIYNLSALGVVGKPLEEFAKLYPHIGILGVMIPDGSSRGSLRKVGRTFIHYPFGWEDQKTLRMLSLKLLRVLGHHPGIDYLRLGIWPHFPSKIDKAYAELGFFAKDELTELEKYVLNPRVSMTYAAFHPLGTTSGIIGDKSSGHVEGIKNLYIVDGSAIVGPTFKNPMGTIYPVALLKGDNIAGEMGR